MCIAVFSALTLGWTGPVIPKKDLVSIINDLLNDHISATSVYSLLHLFIWIVILEITFRNI